MLNRAISTAVMRASEEDYFNSDKCCEHSELMGCAGKGLAQEVEDLACRFKGKESVIVCVCGKGNNGGDGYAMSYILKQKGYNIIVYGDMPKTDDARQYREKCEERSIEIRSLTDFDSARGADIVVDCLLGIGFSGVVKENIADIVDKINDANLIVSCDIPSGLNSDNGIADRHCVRADITVTMYAVKVGMILNDGLDKCGEIRVVPLNDLRTVGSEYEIVTDRDIEQYFPPRRRNTHKGSYGVVGIVACSDSAVGAGIFAVDSASSVIDSMCMSSGDGEYIDNNSLDCASIGAECAMRAGSGLCKLFVPKAVLPQMLYRITNATVATFDRLSDSRVDAIAYGMGVKDNDLIDEVLSKGVPTVLDADALNILSNNLDRLRQGKDIIITPHPLEFARLTGRTVREVLSDPITIAKDFAEKYGVTVLLKGASTVITDGERVAINITGSPAMAKGGSGDILSGVIVSLLARKISPFEAGKVASFVCGLAGERLAKMYGEWSVCASDMPSAIKEIITEYTLQ